LIHQPQVLLLDEPTTGVDAVSRSEFWQMLQSLKRKGITVVVATPYMDEAVQCQRVGLMQEGVLLKVDTPEGIISDFAKDLYSIKGSDIYQLLQDLRVYPNVYSVFPFGQSVHYTDLREHLQMEEIKQYLVDKGHTKIEISKIKPGIEDCFMALSSQNKLES